MSQLLPLSLRPWPSKDENAQTLPVLIGKVTEERGHLRDVTESGLHDAIRDEELGVETSIEPGESDAHTNTKESIQKAREEIFKQIGQAHSEAFFALDLVSLLLSEAMPRQAELSMSTYLKQHAPMKSLGMGKIEAQRRSEAEIEDIKLVSHGWKMEGLQSAADSLLRSASRLEKEIERETNYWECVLQISEKGWPVYRLPRERHTLGVRLGFGEAAPEFRDQGLAALRTSDSGDVMLDQGPTALEAKALRVRAKKGMKTGTSRLPYNVATDGSIEPAILEARNSLFEQELFHELSREAKKFPELEIETVGSSITFSIPKFDFVIDLVAAADVDKFRGGDASELDQIADFVAVSLRVLLSQAHRRKLQLRSEQPPPLTTEKRTVAPSLLLRPILVFSIHQSEVQKFASSFDALQRSSSFAGLEATHTIDVGVNCMVETSGISSVYSIVDTFGTRLASNVVAAVFGLDLHISIVTQSTEPNLHTKYTVKISKASRSIGFNVQEECLDYINNLIAVQLALKIVVFSPASAVGELLEDAPGELGWKRVGLQELERSFDKSGKSKRIKTSSNFSAGEISLQWRAMGTSQDEGTCTWVPDGTEKRSLREVVAIAGLFVALE